MSDPHRPRDPLTPDTPGSSPRSPERRKGAPKMDDATLLAGLTQTAAQLVDPQVLIAPLNNFYFTTASSVVIILLGWALTDLVMDKDYKARAERIFRLRLEAFDWNCPQHITPRFSVAEIQEVFDLQKKYISDLQQQIKDLEALLSKK